MDSIRFVDTHTGGEPTRVVVNPPFLESFQGSMAECRAVFRKDWDHFRRAIVCEPRGSDVWVGAAVIEPSGPSENMGVVFFNNVGFLGMCGHGTIGVAVALKHLGLIELGQFALDTPVGTVQVDLRTSSEASIANVDSTRFRHSVPLDLGGGDRLHGDIAWGGNWFFISEDHGLEVSLDNLDGLHARAMSVRRALESQGITGDNGGVIDHIEFIGPPSDVDKADAKSFVLCPGGAYDRSPCGTGTSAKLACLAADGKLMPGDIYRQESIVGSIFQAHFAPGPQGFVRPTVCGTAFVNAQGELCIDDADPFAFGIR